MRAGQAHHGHIYGDIRRGMDYECCSVLLLQSATLSGLMCVLQWALSVQTGRVYIGNCRLEITRASCVPHQPLFFLLTLSSTL